MRIFLWAVLLITTTQSLALANEYCERAKDPKEIRQEAFRLPNHPTISNRGGPFGWGMCWWYSRFFRAAHLLASYRADLPKPTEAEAKVLVRKLLRFKSVVEIPGYLSLDSFSTEWRDVIYKELV